MKSSANTISCETVEAISFEHTRCPQTCTLWHAIIDTDDVDISGLQFVNGLTFGRNTNVWFLPVGVADSFPNLLAYTATYNVVKAIDKSHFEDLRKLRELRLQKNLIQTIADDTFEDLTSLKWLNLGEREITLINSEFLLFLCSSRR